MKVVKSILYVKPGADATADVIGAVVERVKEGGVGAVVVASMNGKAAMRLVEALKGSAKVVSVTEFTYDDETRGNMKKLGVTAVERADLPIQDHREMREALLFFGAGVKAALEVASIAAEKGAAQPGRLIAMAGGGGGLDTALVVRPAPRAEFFSSDPAKRMAVLEVIAMPLGE